MIALLSLACIFIVAFVLIETYFAADPIMPMRLFKIRNYATASWVSFFAGFAMTAGYVYLPLHFQLVNQNTASQSGVALIPMMLGLPVGAILCGVIVTSTGLYRDKPIVGAAVLIIANWLYSTLTSTSTPAQRVGYLILGGLALGPLVQVPLLQAQNCVPAKDMAVTSSAQQFFQSVGGLLSTAIAQTALNNRLQEKFAPIIADFGGGNGAPLDMAVIQACCPALYDRIIDAYTYGVAGVFYVGMAGAACALVGALFTEHIPLKDGIADGSAEAAAMGRPEKAFPEDVTAVVVSPPVGLVVREPQVEAQAPAS